ncbi:hypothetical protein ACMD2_26000 [Ananas comosus]|uniref:Uncharacterized protein n=1 Tax=Ananas comosus TaxID=4615 RepID=A0A199VI65_ANACO|nr:hypothetical protein ACMD2_26000 [Ananas comosus]
MRLRTCPENTEDKADLEAFAKWTLDLGDGKISAIKLDNEEEPTWIKIPDDILIKNSGNGVRDIVASIYDNLEYNYNDAFYLRDRAIITPINETATNTLLNQKYAYLLQAECLTSRFSAPKALFSAPTARSPNSEIYSTKFPHSHYKF